MPQVYESVRDFKSPANAYPFDQQNPDLKAAYPAKLRACLDKYLPRFEALIEANPDSDTFIVQDTWTFADVALADALMNYVEITGGEEFLAPYPKVTALAKAIWALPGVAAYLKSPLHYPLGDAVYVANVNTVLRR